MGRRFVKELGQQESVDEVFLASGKQLRPNRNGNLYLQVELSDRTGAISARMWNATESLYRSFDNGDYVRVCGTTQLYQGSLQLIATRLTKVFPEEVREEDFVPLPSTALEKLVARLSELLRSLEDPQLKTLAECFLLDDQFMEQFARAPAGVKHHHAYQGGLLEHVVNLMEVANRVAPCYPQINRDLLLAGAFLHDIGKVSELSYQRELAYTDEGQLIGHLVMGVGLLDAKVREAERLSGEAFPEDLLLRLKHMIVSHHGQYEFGSPKLPMTLEALALYYLDSLDAKVFAFHQQLEDDPNVDSSWTCFHPTLGRKLFKGIVAPE
ncbi:MAG TPA: HD domain-containing protein [Planctomycetaceae bacterium]|nr:HD domain-containing protein [Planctomycetaceae bacterium]HIQ21592.1 HD domain-containing protein [Planctomycetota bacterium]